jgi:hypothetical protein
MDSKPLMTEVLRYTKRAINEHECKKEDREYESVKKLGYKFSKNL